MRRRITTAIVFLSLSAAVLAVSCYHMDVRMGMGEGNGVGLSYRIVGEGPPLVVIHDGPGYEKMLMYPGFDDLARDMKVIYYDQRGCGRSEELTPLESLTLADNVEDLEALRQYFRLDTFSIAAHGWGAVIALEYVRKYEEFVNGVMLITPISPFAPEPTHDTVLDNLPRRARIAVFDVLNHPTMSMVERRERLMRLVLPSLFYNGKAAGLIRARQLRYAADVNIRLSDELKTLDMFPVLDEITLPTLVIIGRHDISTPVRDQMAYADGIRSASAVVFNDSGHFPFLEERSFFLSVAREFILHNRIPALVKAVKPD